MSKKSGERKIKCVTWDLDNTIWDGVILEDKKVTLRDGVKKVIKELDRQGILQSIASKNDHSVAMKKLQELGLADYFIYPQINWNAKSDSIRKIAKAINIGIETIAFIDDQEFERDEVKFFIPEVLCIEAEKIDILLDMPEMNPKYITCDSKHRRQMYQNDIKRKKEEENFNGSKEEFLMLLNMKLTITPVGVDDLQRAEELTVRTHQLNSTGYTYSFEKLDSLRESNEHKLFIAGLDDKYGTYGKVGLVLIECIEKAWTIKLLLLSCRVMSRGIGTILINYIKNLAREAGVNLYAEYVSNERNRMMYITYRFTGFNELKEFEGKTILKCDLGQLQPIPEYVVVKATM